jgi:nicotinamidase-related amidase
MICAATPDLPRRMSARRGITKRDVVFTHRKEDKLMNSHQLLDVGECVLVAIDVQTAFLQKLETKASTDLASRIAWTLGAAAWFGVPIVVTAEDVPRLGGVTDEVAGRLVGQTVVYNKMSFDLTGDPDIVAAIRATGKQTAMLLGLETDVCVAQSAIGLLRLGYRVVAASDCTGSPGPAHAAGLQRMAGAGALTLPSRSILYEWLRTVERSRRFREEYVSRNPGPEGLTL